MMGEEPLEVPPASNNHEHYTNHQAYQPPHLQDHQAQPPELPWLSDSTQQSERERALSRERIVNAYGSTAQQPGTSAQVSSGKPNGLVPGTSPSSAPRRTRHRVDAGEPRGCFNTTTSIPNQLNHHGWGHQIQNRSNHFGNRFHPHFLPPNQFVHHQFQGATLQQQPQRRSPPADPYYFQPMKMLSEFITSASAAAQAVHPNQQRSTRNNCRENQLLLREMLCKNSNMGTETGSPPKLNNNEYDDKVPKPSKLEGMIGIMMDKLSGPEVEETESSKAPVESQEQEQDSENTRNVAAADLLNNNTSQNSQAQAQVSRNKRKKYQPQKSDLVECSDGVGNGVDDIEEEFEQDIKDMGSEEEEEQEDTRRVTRSQARMHSDLDGSAEDLPSDFTTQEIKSESTRVKRKLPQDFLSDIDEDEAMLLRQVVTSRSSAATTNPDDAESMIYENEEDEQEAMINDDLQHESNREQEIGSRRTLPVVRNLMKIHQKSASSVKEAPLTRQLLTSERPTSTPSASEKSSILRPSLQTPRHPTPIPSDPINTPTGNTFLNQWKENLKTTLMSHINELVDAQFSLLLGGGMVPPSSSLVLPQRLPQDHDRRSLRESNNPRQVETPKQEQKRTPPPQQQPQQQPPRSHTPRDLNPHQKPMIHLNGGSVLNTEKLQMMQNQQDVKKLPVGRASNTDRSEYPGIPPRFPFMQNNERGMIPQAIQQNGKPHFSSALVGLSNHHLQQQAVAAAVAANAVAAGIENMFDNDGALSLVVNRNSSAPAQGINDLVHGNVTPRKKRHKVTDTRLTPRAVSRLLGQVDQQPSTSPLYDHQQQQPSPQSSPQHHNNTPQIEPRSILQNGTPPPHREPQPRERTTPQQQNQPQERSLFNPFHPQTQNTTPFFHPAALAAAAAAGHPLHPSQLARLESPPMSNSLLHPALQNPSEYVERLREMSMERERDHHPERNTRVGSDNVVVRDRGDHHHHASLREYPSVRGLRDRGTAGGGIMLGNEMLELIGRAGSAGGSDSGGESGSGAFDLGGGGGMYCHTTSTLTPMHLRKAKLMFFWTRYPSSAVIKMYFPDIKFNKNNTAQLVKWFSNFREFYYIQMEKYARQALSEGVKQAEDLVVTTDSELYRVLNLHYNRNNHIEVPSNFRYVVEQTLREFFKSVQAGKDSEQSWKKAIYKIIARLDDPVPEYFKSPNFLEQLE